MRRKRVEHERNDNAGDAWNAWRFPLASAAGVCGMVTASSWASARRRTDGHNTRTNAMTDLSTLSRDQLIALVQQSQAAAQRSLTLKVTVAKTNKDGTTL